MISMDFFLAFTDHALERIIQRIGSFKPVIDSIKGGKYEVYSVTKNPLTKKYKTYKGDKRHDIRIIIPNVGTLIGHSQRRKGKHSGKNKVIIYTVLDKIFTFPSFTFLDVKIVGLTFGHKNIAFKSVGINET